MTKHTIAGADTQACIFDFLKKNPNKTSAQISQSLVISQNVVDLAIKKLIKGGFIEFKKNNFSRSIKKIKEMRNAK